jgi:hypothetical protein
MESRIVFLLILAIVVGCEEKEVTEATPQRELIVFAPAGNLTPPILEKFTRNHKAGDRLTIVELTETGPQKIGSRTKVARWTAKEAQKAGPDQRQIAEFVNKSVDAQKAAATKIDMPSIFRVASEIRKAGTPLDVIVMASPIHTVPGAFDCTDGFWVSDGVITQEGTPFSQKYENLDNATFWFIPKGWPWGKNDKHEQASIRTAQLLANKHGAHLAYVSPDIDSVAAKYESRQRNLLSEATLTSDERVCLYQDSEWTKVEAQQAIQTPVTREVQSGPVRPVTPILPNWVQQVFQDAQEAGRSVVAVCWRTPLNASQPIDVDLYAIKSDVERIFFAEAVKPFGRLSRDVRASNSQSANEVDEATWEVIDVDGSLKDYEWCLNYYSGAGAASLNLTVIYRDATTKNDKTVTFDWSPEQSDQAAGYHLRGSSTSWRALAELKQ